MAESWSEGWVSPIPTCCADNECDCEERESGGPYQGEHLVRQHVHKHRHLVYLLPLHYLLLELPCGAAREFSEDNKQKQMLVGGQLFEDNGQR